VTFIEAAIHLLEQAGEPLSVDELARRAVELDLVTPGKHPLRSMKTRLTTEAKKGDDSAVVKIGDDLWTLRNGAAPARVETAAEPVEEATQDAAEVEAETGEVPELPAVEPDPELDVVLAPSRQPRRVAEPLPPDELEAAEMYADELEAVAPAAAHSEYEDEQTADEDRPMMAEITSGRHRRRDRERRRRGDRDRDRRRRGGRDRDRGEDRADARKAGDEPGAERAPETERAPEAERAPEEASAEPRRERPRLDAGRGDVAPYRAGNALGDGAELALSELKDRQPVQVKQLAQMMRKRKLLAGDPNQSWPHLKAALLQDAESYREHGLRPRIVYRGRDLFVLAHYDLDDEVRKAEIEIAEAVDHLAAATHRALRDRLCRMDARVLERIVHTYLIRIGWTEIDWIKRVDRSCYASALPVGALGPVMVGVRAGDQLVDRRGVGELRAGVEAKGLRNGVLLAPQPLSEEAHKELERGGRAVSVLCGDAFVTALIEAGVAVRKSTAPVILVDDEFLDEVR
jgi:hypothetical protein